jgi:hypothetical protein
MWLKNWRVEERMTHTPNRDNLQPPDESAIVWVEGGRGQPTLGREALAAGVQY